MAEIVQNWACFVHHEYEIGLFFRCASSESSQAELGLVFQPRLSMTFMRTYFNLIWFDGSHQAMPIHKWYLFSDYYVIADIAMKC